MVYRHTIDATSYVFGDLRDLLAKATPPRSGDRLAGIAADSAEQMIAARMALADVPLGQFLEEPVIPFEDDEVTRLIIDGHDAQAFAPISSLTVGSFRDFLLSDAASSEELRQLSRGITPEMAAAVSKLMRNQDLILVARKCEAITAFRNTIGMRGRMSTRLQPNHPFDDARGITASILDGLLLGSGDACIGINPASDDPAVIGGLLRLLDEFITRLEMPTQGCVLTHVTTTLKLIEQGLPVDLVFQSVAGTEAARPRPRPITPSNAPLPSTSLKIALGCEPSANRMPNSFVHWLTEYEITPYVPIRARINATLANTAISRVLNLRSEWLLLKICSRVRIL